MLRFHAKVNLFFKNPTDAGDSSLFLIVKGFPWRIRWSERSQSSESNQK